MRPIKFRGKTKLSIEELNERGIEHTDGWIIGNLIVNGDKPMIVGDLIEIDDEYIVHEQWCSVVPESVGQYTGVNDKEDTEIYDNSLVDMGNLYFVKWSKKYCGYRLYAKDGSSTALNPHHSKDYEVIGSTYEELLEGAHND